MLPVVAGQVRLLLRSSAARRIAIACPKNGHQPIDTLPSSVLGLYRGNPLVISGLWFWSGQRKFFKENLANPANQY